MQHCIIAPNNRMSSYCMRRRAPNRTTSGGTGRAISFSYPMVDGWEVSYGIDPLHTGSLKYILMKNYDYDTVSNESLDDGPDGDPDKDSFYNDEEYEYGTSPTSADSDGDGLIDGEDTEAYRDSEEFKLWESQGIPYVNISGYKVMFYGETDQSTNRTNPDTDFDNVTDGQEVHGYNVMISWFEGEELKSLNKTTKEHPWGAHFSR